MCLATTQQYAWWRHRNMQFDDTVLISHFCPGLPVAFYCFLLLCSDFSSFYSFLLLCCVVVFVLFAVSLCLCVSVFFYCFWQKVVFWSLPQRSSFWGLKSLQRNLGNRQGAISPFKPREITRVVPYLANLAWSYSHAPLRGGRDSTELWCQSAGNSHRRLFTSKVPGLRRAPGATPTSAARSSRSVSSPRPQRAPTATGPC